MKLQNFLFIAISFITISFIAFLPSVLGYRPDNNVNGTFIIQESPSLFAATTNTTSTNTTNTNTTNTNTTSVPEPVESISQLLNSLQQQKAKLDEQMQQSLIQGISNILHNYTSTGYVDTNSGLLGYNGDLN
ncbi:hypothetical protein ACR3K2_22000 [Cryptosporidium serpentis]